MISHADGYRVWDVDGREFVDASSLSSTCGYGRPELIRAVDRQTSMLHGLDLSVSTHEPAGLLAERIASYLSDEFRKTLFVNSGSEALEAAMNMANAYWANIGEPRSRVVALRRGYHGSTLMTRSLSGLPRVGHSFTAPLPVTFVDLPGDPAEVRRADSLPLLVAAFEEAIGDTAGGPPAAVLVEPFLNVGGGVVMPPGFLYELRRLCDAAETLLVLDEVFTGYGRAGRMFACQREQVEPDVLVTSKGLSGGYVPIGAVTVRQHVYDSFAQESVIGGLRYGHTTSGHAVACVAALATLDVVEKENLPERAEQFGTLLVDRLAPLAGKGDVVDVRGLGLIVVLEMTSAAAADGLMNSAYDWGLLLRQQTEAVMAVPPLTIDEAGVGLVAERIEQSVLADRG